MHRLKAHIRSLEKQDGIRHLDLRRVVNQALGGGDGHGRYWSMVTDNNINTRFATEIESEMDGQQHKNYPKTVEAMRRRWNASPDLRGHFGGEFIEKPVNKEKSVEEILLELMREYRGKPRKKPDDSKPKKKRKSDSKPKKKKRKSDSKPKKKKKKSKKTDDGALRAMKNRIDRRRAGKK